MNPENPRPQRRSIGDEIILAQCAEWKTCSLAYHERLEAIARFVVAMALEQRDKLDPAHLARTDMTEHKVVSNALTVVCGLADIYLKTHQRKAREAK